ncbi:hypothetical protein M9H77_06792 [Catharanthus roseus]|uniref:Uncharacterized protein n=1 Tax=Catharanthus roseus TaxID=4058 RepID=A0ACC0BTD2_CATRO|nr:hypothetical protein M9H77_06792 [Catharanthus roseus]
MVEESSKIKELSQAKFQEHLKIRILDKTSKEEPYCVVNEKSIEIKEKERVEEKQRLVERTCIFGSISILLKESEHLEVDECHFNIANYVSYVLGIEDKGWNMEKELSNLH